ncbi:adenosylhomocysteine nucleosidase [Aequitasia blattaphilus]|uniref:adenosylhomocysteine nucleosidase n=1 Tax=Aequitasia blattaphilus TaxID=2949332 RepID=A0ABT1E9F3_9FIRM|nr:5'-methylthioadenosine/adenosylhomocysteine nucleosidase [Aequitasia blattaphilus]MCP1102463.1 5'-methylthioadenosine/adenosylhomocysteine nucleosidase [Aequitasia blattaphilus]MCR8615103.1 5'-methylthioadenosine/adenosylhomocysteine nucleosidase [Aequitasia blattaphilus]
MIGIIGAMEEEVAALIGEMKEISSKEKASMIFYTGKLMDQEVVIVRSGIGKVNAGICTQILVDEYQVESVINTGIAGSLDPDINIGDIVISSDAVQHDMDATGFGYEKGQIPRMDTKEFTADRELGKRMKVVNEEVNPDIQTFMGRIASGDQFIADGKIKNDIIEEFQAKCVEMEGGAIAQVAYLNHIPYVIIRAISDKADNSAEVDYPTFEKQAILHVTRLMKAYLKSL